MPTRLHYPIVDSIALRDQSLKLANFKAATVHRRVAEHVEEDGLSEVVEEGDDLSALGAEDVHLVEDGGDALLLREGRQRDAHLPDVVAIDLKKSGPSSFGRQFICGKSEPLPQISEIQVRQGLKPGYASA
jgi:hypothetical protein